MTGTSWAAVAVGLLMPVAMIGCYPVYRYHSRHDPNSWSGYRTQRAMSSVRNWRVAQAMCGRHWVVIGTTFSVLTVIEYGLLYAAGSRDAQTWWRFATLDAFAPLVGIVWSVALIEKRLKQLDGSEPQRA